MQWLNVPSHAHTVLNEQLTQTYEEGFILPPVKRGVGLCAIPRTCMAQEPLVHVVSALAARPLVDASTAFDCVMLLYGRRKPPNIGSPRGSMLIIRARAGRAAATNAASDMTIRYCKVFPILVMRWVTSVGD